MMETDELPSSRRKRPSFLERVVLLLALPTALGMIMWTSSHTHPLIWRITFQPQICPALLNQGIKVAPVRGNYTNGCQANLSMNWSGQTAHLTAYHQGHPIQLLIPAREIVVAEKQGANNQGEPVDCSSWPTKKAHPQHGMETLIRIKQKDQHEPIFLYFVWTHIINWLDIPGYFQSAGGPQFEPGAGLAESRRLLLRKDNRNDNSKHSDGL
ncbi:MAG: hypothetical protein KGI54_11325 [Pseudomonadota bacterium]|nr:hypothetical protein [Pseudomonadota bacterium]